MDSFSTPLHHSYAQPYQDETLSAPTWMERTDSHWSSSSEPVSDALSWSGSPLLEEAVFSDNNDDFLLPPDSHVLIGFDLQYTPEPEGSSFAQTLDQDEVFAANNQCIDIEAAAGQATDNAAYILSQNHELPATFITFEAVDILKQELTHAEFPTREAIQSLLYDYLSGNADGTPLANTETLLLEAAYQLLLRTEGPMEEVTKICHHALVVTLLQHEGTVAEPSQPSQPEPATKHAHKKTSKAKAKKKRHVCRTSECSDQPKAFGRAADLDRHHRQVHLGEDMKKKYPCDYSRCGRRKQPFSRQDHFRDHLRDYHREDLTLRGVQADAAWWAARSRPATRGGWWRCNRCLVTRVNIERDEFICPGCGSHCESERVEFRKALLEGNEE